MYPTPEQLALIKQCRELWGADNVYVRQGTERDPNVNVRCVAKYGTSRITYAPDGTILASSLEMAMGGVPEPLWKPGNAIDN